MSNYLQWLMAGYLLLTPQLAMPSLFADDALPSYVRRPDAAYAWEQQNETIDASGKLFEIRLISQIWRGIPWEHRLLVFVPAKVSYPDTLLLVLRQGHGASGESEGLKASAQATGTLCAILYDVPNQPLFGGKEEDLLLAYTFSQYLQTGDETWPLLLPMVKSVVRSMDTIQALGRKHALTPVSRFIVAGHSKRGHTSWLSAAVDERIRGVIPVALDTLNTPAQIPHHREVFAGLSRPAATFEDTIAQADTARGRNLIRMIDPYTYRDRLTLPKLIVLATNDEYYASDALNLYWDGLPGWKWVLYLPNASHVGANMHPSVNHTAFAFVRAVAAGKALPNLSWKFESGDDEVRLRLTSDVAAKSARLWVTSAESRDFLATQWSARAMRLVGNNGRPHDGREAITYVGEVEQPRKGYVAIFAEMDFTQGGESFSLTTQIHISGKGQ
jgi:PhoPQ-activated pathogenicity-related protein